MLRLDGTAHLPHSLTLHLPEATHAQSLLPPLYQVLTVRRRSLGCLVGLLWLGAWLVAFLTMGGFLVLPQKPQKPQKYRYL